MRANRKELGGVCSFIAFFELHGTVKLTLVAGLATNKLGHIQAAIAVFTGFAIYQIYLARPAKMLISADCQSASSGIEKGSGPRDRGGLRLNAISGLRWRSCRGRRRE
jgi:hypothetical protein